MAEQDRQSELRPASGGPRAEDQQSTVKPPPLPARFTRASRKTRTGEVISSGMNKTIVVKSVTRVPHPRFGKIVKQMKKFYAHDEENKAKTGDTVRIMETRPLSKLKRWRLVEVLQK
jgi:small subunit ribosomal protein S17